MAQTQRSKNYTKSVTQERQTTFYPTTLNQERLSAYLLNESGQKIEGRSKNNTINVALNKFFFGIEKEKEQK